MINLNEKKRLIKIDFSRLKLKNKNLKRKNTKIKDD